MAREVNQQNVRFALVCASNQNRSMEAHARLLKNGFNVNSFGTGAHVKLPGPARDKPNIFAFGTPYKQIYEELKEQNYNLYKQNGVLNMLERNMKVKNAPEQWQKETTKTFNIIITFEKRVYDTVYEDLMARGSVTGQPVYLIDLTTTDNHEEAVVGASFTQHLCNMIVEPEDWESHLEQTLEDFQRKHNKALLYTILYY